MHNFAEVFIIFSLVIRNINNPKLNLICGLWKLRDFFIVV